MAALQSVPPEICSEILEELNFQDLAAAYASLPYTWRAAAYRIAILRIYAYLNHRHPQAACSFGSNGGFDWFKQLPHATRFKYKDLPWSPDLQECPTTVSIDGSSMVITITPASNQKQDVSSRREFCGTGKGEPFEIKRITLWLDPSEGHEASGSLYFLYSIADIPMFKSEEGHHHRQ